MDKGLSFKPEEAKEELKLGGAENLKDVWILPTNTAKFVNPLDNSLWHSLNSEYAQENPGLNSEPQEY